MKRIVYEQPKANNNPSDNGPTIHEEWFGKHYHSSLIVLLNKYTIVESCFKYV